MKISIGAAHNMLSILQRIDHDPGIHISDVGRLAVAININRLLKDVQSYERQRNKIVVDMKAQGAIDENGLADKDAELRSVEIEVDLTKVKLEDLKTDGSYVRGLSALAPMISDMEPAT